MIHNVRAIPYFVAGIAILVSSHFAVAAEPVDHAAVVAPFVNDDTFLAIYFDVASLRKPDNFKEVLFVLPALSQEAKDIAIGAMIFGTLVDQFHKAGGQGVYWLAGLGDVRTPGGPVVVATAAPGKRPADVEKLVRDLIQGIRNDPAQSALRRIADELAVRRHGDVVLIGTKATVERYASFQPAPRPDLVDPLSKLTDAGASAACVVSPGPDFRRVVRELWPELPEPLSDLRGELADRWLHLEASAKLTAGSAPSMVLQASDREAAETFVNVLRDLPAAAEKFEEIGERRHELKRLLQTILEALPPKLDGTRVALTVPTDQSERAKLGALITGATDAAMESNRRDKRIHQFKTITLAMLNYESSKKHLPPAAIADSEGRALLSWRVAILPFIDEGDLYKQFHLDEPWDSPHNRRLIEKMPSAYADPSDSQLAGEGKTTYQVPAGPQTIFHDNLGTVYRDIKDGTSQTMILVEVEPTRAVVWTKPDDWEVDVQNFRRGIERSDRRQFTAGFADGHVTLLPVTVDEKQLRAMVTRSGGETIEWP